MEKRKAAVIIADTGFSPDSLAGATRILGGVRPGQSPSHSR